MAMPTPGADATQPAAKRSHVFTDPRVNQALAQRARQQAIADQQAAKDAHYLDVNAQKEANYLETKRQADAESNVNHALNQLRGGNQRVNAQLRTIAREHGWGKTEMDYAENRLGRRIFPRPAQPAASTPGQPETPATLADETSQ